MLHHLVGRVGRPGLLTVAEGRVGDEDVAGLRLRRIEFHRLSIDVLDHRPVEPDQRRQTVRKRFFQQIGFGAVDQRMRRLFLGHDRSIPATRCSKKLSKTLQSFRNARKSATGVASHSHFDTRFSLACNPPAVSAAAAKPVRLPKNVSWLAKPTHCNGWASVSGKTLSACGPRRAVQETKKPAQGEAGFLRRVFSRERRYAELGYLLPMFSIEPAVKNPVYRPFHSARQLLSTLA